MTKQQQRKRLKESIEKRYSIYELLHESNHLDEGEQRESILSALVLTIQINELKEILS